MIPIFRNHPRQCFQLCKDQILQNMRSHINCNHVYTTLDVPGSNFIEYPFWGERKDKTTHHTRNHAFTENFWTCWELRRNDGELFFKGIQEVSVGKMAKYIITLNHINEINEEMLKFWNCLPVFVDWWAFIIDTVYSDLRTLHTPIIWIWSIVLSGTPMAHPNTALQWTLMLTLRKKRMTDYIMLWFVQLWENHKKLHKKLGFKKRVKNLRNIIITRWSRIALQIMYSMLSLFTFI